MNYFTNFAINGEVKNIMFNMVLGLIAGIIIAAGYIIANKERKFSKKASRS